MENRQGIAGMRLASAGRALERGSALLCAVLMLCVLPLLFHNAFFDINRIKVQAVCTAVPPLALAFLVGHLLQGKKRIEVRGGRAVLACLLLLLLSCVVSCARTGFEPATLTGSEGRSCGLDFMLYCGTACVIIAFGLKDARPLMALMMLCSSLCAALGVLNAAGIDPLGFYTFIRPGQEQVFLSTIGNFDFFGTYLVMLLPVSAAQAIFGKRAGMRRFGAVCAAVVMLGAASSRTDCAFAGTHLVCLALLALSGNRWAHIARALGLWAAAFACQAAVGPLLALSPYNPDFSGVPAYLARSGLALALCAALAAATLLCALLAHRGVRAPGRRGLCRAALALALAAVLALLGAMAYFTLMDTQTPLGELEPILRFGDSWGSYRGFIYTRALRAYGDYGWADRLFGRGMEKSRAILEPYCEAEITALVGTYNDPHCQVLQFLLTCGLFGAAAFIALYIAALRTAGRRPGEDAPRIALLVSLLAYALVALLNVTQPILIATYLSLVALTVALSRHPGGDAQGKENTPRES